MTPHLAMTSLGFPPSSSRTGGRHPSACSVNGAHARCRTRSRSPETYRFPLSHNRLQTALAPATRIFFCCGRSFHHVEVDIYVIVLRVDYGEYCRAAVPQI